MICYRCNDALSCKSPEAKPFKDEDGVLPCVDCLQELIVEKEEKRQEAWSDEAQYWEDVLDWGDCDD